MDIVFDSAVRDDERRKQLYTGDIFVYSPNPATRALCAFAREMAEQAFHPLDPREAQHSMPVEQFAGVLAELKPAFIHDSRTKTLLQDVMRSLGCDLAQCYFDVPRMRSSTSGGYLKSGIAYAFHPHRDTWYSAPLCQINWWLPMYPVQRGSGMNIYPEYWNNAVRNGSRTYNYAQWNRESRYNAAQHIHKDTRIQPKPEEAMNLKGAVSIEGPPGSLTMFSAAQMHASADNQGNETRFSVDFRTVHWDDVVLGKGAANVDSECAGTTMGDYLRGSSLAHLPQEWIDRYEAGWAR
ncbi:MAG: hypothetical protein ACR2PZ_24460 [Pseudomonadales bacterium]